LNGHLGIVKLLIEVGVDKDGGQATTPLINASFNGHTEIVQYLVEQNVEINKMVAGKSAVMIACWMYHFNIASVLVEAGAVVSQGSAEWVKRGVMFYRKIAFEQNVWAMSTDATGNPIKVKKSKISDVVVGITLKDKMSYLTAEENATMSRIEGFFSTGKECIELKPIPKVVLSNSGRRVSTGPRKSVRRQSINRQALNLDVSCGFLTLDCRSCWEVLLHPRT
jgi:hypothetical protein